MTKRVNRGVPTGGQFAADKKLEPSGSLSGWDDGSGYVEPTDEEISQSIDPGWEAQHTIAPVIPITSAGAAEQTLPAPELAKERALAVKPDLKLVPQAPASTPTPITKRRDLRAPKYGRYPEVKQPEAILRGFVDPEIGRDFVSEVNHNMRFQSPEKARAACRDMLPTVGDDAYDQVYSEAESYLEELHAQGGGGLYGDDWDEMDEKVKAAVIIGNGPVDPNYTPPSSVSVEGGGYGGNAYKGTKHDEAEGKTPAEIGRMIRADMKEAQKAGWIPENVKISVTRGYASNYNVSIRGMSNSFIQSDKKPASAWNNQSEEAKELSHRVDTIANAYGFNDNNSQVDYFNYHRTAHSQYEDVRYDD